MLRRSAASGWVVILAGLAASCVLEESRELPPVTAGGKPAMALTLQDARDAALADAARRTGLPLSTLRVESAESVTWPDGSLGCPQPGTMYPQMLVPGYRIRIRAGQQVLDYHGATRGPPFLCPPERTADPIEPRDAT